MSNNKRVTDILPSLWFKLKKGREGLPNQNDIEPKDIEELIKDSFLFEAYFGNEEPILKENIVISYTNHENIFNSIGNQLKNHMHEVYDSKVPKIFEQEFHLTDKRIVKYRESLIPFETKDKKHTYIIGAIRWKIFR